MSRRGSSLFGFTGGAGGGGGGSGGAGVPAAPSSNGFYLLSVSGGVATWAIATTDEISPGFAPSLALASGGSGPYELGASWTPTFSTSPAPNASGITSPTRTDNQGHAAVAISGGNPFGPPTVSSYALNAPGYVSVYATLTQSGVTKNTNPVNVFWGSKVWYGVGSAGATGLNGTTGALVGATGTLTSNGVSTNGVVAFNASPSAQKVYYASDTYYGARTFKDANGFGFAMNAPSSISVTNAQGVARTFYLYESQNALSSVANPITPS